MLGSLGIAVQGWLSPTLLKIASQGLLQGGDEPEPTPPQLPGVYIRRRPRRVSAMDAVIFAFAGGLVR